MDIVFCKTRWHYGSYTDYWRLVELAGFEQVYLDELEPGRKAVYIVSPRNGELPTVLPRLQGRHDCKFVWWCLERPDAQGSVTESQPVEQAIDELWLSDRWLAGMHEDFGWAPVRYVTLGSHRDLGQPGKQTEFDWTHLSYAIPRRQAIYNFIGGKMLPNCWDVARHEGLQGTRIMLNVHQDEWPVVEPLRWALAAAYALHLISERVHDPYPLRPGIDFVWSQHGKLVEVVQSFMANPKPGYGPKLRDRLTRQFEFGKCVKEAVSCLLS